MQTTLVHGAMRLREFLFECATKNELKETDKDELKGQLLFIQEHPICQRNSRYCYHES